MATEPKDTKPRKPRAPRRDFATERARLVMHCKLSIGILTETSELSAGDGHDTYAKGQIAALKAVLKLMGETE